MLQAFLGASQWEMGGRAFPPPIKVTWGKTGESVGDLLKGTGPSAVDLGTELWNSGSLTPREVLVAWTGWLPIT